MFSKVDEAMQRYVDDEILPGVSYKILKGTEIVHAGQVGYADIESKTPLRDDAIFRIASNTKLMTSVVLMMLYERGSFDLHDPLANYLPEFTDMLVLQPNATRVEDATPAANPILIRHLLSHSAGLSYGFVEPDSVIDKAYEAASLGGLAGIDADLEAYTHALAELPLAFEPGSGWRYSVATDVCARLIEVLSGQKFDVCLAQMLLQPLGLIDTGFFVPEDKIDRLTTLYTPVHPFEPMKGGLTVAPMFGERASTQKPKFLSGGGGLVSTLPDYSRFIQMIMNDGQWGGRQYLLPETLKLMRENQLADGVVVNFPFWPMPGTVFGLGFALKEKPSEAESALAVNEYHWGGLMGTHSWIAPEANIAALCFTQRFPGFWHPFSHEFKRLVYEAAEVGF